MLYMFSATICGENQTILERTCICVCNKLPSQYAMFSFVIQLARTVNKDEAAHTHYIAILLFLSFSSNNVYQPENFCNVEL